MKHSKTFFIAVDDEELLEPLFLGTNTYALLIVLDVDDNDVYKVQTREPFNT